MSTITHTSAPSSAVVHRTLIVLLAAVAAVLLAVTITVLVFRDTAPSIVPNAPAEPAVQEVPLAPLAPPAGSGYSVCRGQVQLPDRVC